MAWEQLHSGPWDSVCPAWRDAYAMSCLHVAACHSLYGDDAAALRALDMGLLMGGPLLRPDLSSAVNRILSRSAKTDARADSHALIGNGNQVLQRLPERSLDRTMVDRRRDIDLESFLCEYFLTGKPVVIAGSMDHWPARTKWRDVDYLRRVAGDRTVPVEVGKNYLSSEWKQELITFSEFLDRICSVDQRPKSMTYLAQHNLFDQIQELHEDIFIPDYCYAGGGELQSMNAWFGPAGTVTPLHHDPHHNIFAQAIGKKYIRLYPAAIVEELYPYSETMLCNSSQVDLDNFDAKAFPKAQDLEFMDCVLEEGEMLYIPPKWWHYVKSLTTSFSVSFWWSSECNTTVS
ncbi:hypothetical protein QJS04_geneDACA016332 [Acorus gramineus]|uniref:JmjC domain-containing protein n=2 Tax=Acorus TaxID=4464 RepID=A0AAV9APG4_ACOGR|nr:hypothetical protein QJS04_geneDACA016332 [Acorus gramineus]